jgi:hypothetical protein
MTYRVAAHAPLAFLVVKFQEAVVHIRHELARKLCMQQANFTGFADMPIKGDPQAAGGWLAVFRARFLCLLRVQRRHVGMRRKWVEQV